MTDCVLIAVDDLAEIHLARIEAAARGWASHLRIAQQTQAAAFADHLKTATVHFGWARPEWLLESSVRFHQLPSVGYDDYIGRGLKAKHLYTLCNAGGVMGVPVAEHAVALMFALVRKLSQHVRDQSLKQWQRHMGYEEVAGATACIVGLGDIGTELARRCQALGMRVVGVRRDATRTHQHVERIHPVADLAEAVAEADHVFLVLPQTRESYGMFDSRIFASMRRGARFYNLARGGIVDERALIENLASGHLAGAGLDVFAEEPLPRSNSLWEFENVVITPHAAGRSTREFDRLTDLFVANLQRYREGAELINVIPHERL